MNDCFTAQNASENGAYESPQKWEAFVKEMESQGKKPSGLALSIARKKIPELSGEITV